MGAGELVAGESTRQIPSELEGELEEKGAESLEARRARRAREAARLCARWSCAVRRAEREVEGGLGEEAAVLKKIRRERNAAGR